MTREQITGQLESLRKRIPGTERDRSYWGMWHDSARCAYENAMRENIHICFWPGGDAKEVEGCGATLELAWQNFLDELGKRLRSNPLIQPLPIEGILLPSEADPAKEFDYDFSGPS